jgi:hypothetical protein
MAVRPTVFRDHKLRRGNRLQTEITVRAEANGHRSWYYQAISVRVRMGRPARLQNERGNAMMMPYVITMTVFCKMCIMPRNIRAPAPTPIERHLGTITMLYETRQCEKYRRAIFPMAHLKHTWTAFRGSTVLTAHFPPRVDR